MRKTIAALLTAAGLVLVGITPAHAAADRPSKPCKYEDSSWCVWDAKHRGNGEGRSFWVGRGGKVHYVSHATAHRMLHG